VASSATNCQRGCGSLALLQPMLNPTLPAQVHWSTLTSSGNITTTANISGQYFLGNGAFLTGLSGVGAQGTTGAQGATGTQGTTGTNGVQGTTGVQGAVGTQGITGTNGTNGTQGTTGSDGVQGTTGAVGAQGAVGSTGVQGTTGSDGVQGTIGAGAQGVQGQTGTTGAATVIIGSTALTTGNEQAELNAAFPSATPGEGVIDQSGGNLWVLGTGVWTDVGQIVGPQGTTGSNRCTRRYWKYRRTRHHRFNRCTLAVQGTIRCARHNRL
jgi:collagen type I alpha